MLTSLSLLTITEKVQAQNVDEPFTIVEEMPKFPGGNTKMMKFIANNVKYPKEAEKNKIEGRSLVEFIIEKDGSISNVKTKVSTHPLLDKEAIRVIKAMPNWTPGTQKGKKVRVSFVIPIEFRLK